MPDIGAVKLDELPRMADFALWMSACEPGLGWDSGRFMGVYASNREDVNEMALEASPIGAPLITLMASRNEWTGTATDLLRDLESLLPKDGERIRRPQRWPKDATRCSGALTRITPNLRAQGIRVDRERSGDRRITIGKLDAADAMDADSPITCESDIQLFDDQDMVLL